VSPVANICWQQRRHAGRTWGTQIFVQAVNDKHQVPAGGDDVFGRLFPERPELVQVGNRWIYIDKVRQLWDNRSEEVVAISVGFPTRQEVRHNIYRRRQRCPNELRG
jgi:hypothetical protein